MRRTIRRTIVSRHDPLISGGARLRRPRPATLRVAGAPEGCRFAAAGPNNVSHTYNTAITMRAWPVARSIFDAPLVSSLCERSERADNKLDNTATDRLLLNHSPARSHVTLLFCPLLQNLDGRCASRISSKFRPCA